MPAKILTPVFGFDYLKIAKSYLTPSNVSEERDCSIKAVVFSVMAAEALANFEGYSFLNLRGKDLDNFILCRVIYKGHSGSSDIYHKWKILLEKIGMEVSQRNPLLKGLEDAVALRNKLVHFKPHKNQFTQEMVPDGKTTFQGIEYVEYKPGGIAGGGVLGKLNVSNAKKHFSSIDELILQYYLVGKSLWPVTPDFLNEHYGSASSFYEK
ncbi:MAG: hypothetical protein A2756_01795 [Candidatus Ryanbacteria bacterium RIFCSPHIGHO2_01_FULL_48_27]|uniref:Uncharacterized protein n=1 Tax=Candidatus Ryanbacteria bacterium RIFCSPHIGHO2_01_FULL_48_27 TaxID=1802115 RepID=A0A1G2G5S6_9BACT|nr:MAG: hypothetical protein A2756_01795 [Candidatus Ryanbacteria bacterium RIFCSPHIGHO2_01_FULL_48_27]